MSNSGVLELLEKARKKAKRETESFKKLVKPKHNSPRYRATCVYYDNFGDSDDFDCGLMNSPRDSDYKRDIEDAERRGYEKAEADARFNEDMRRAYGEEMPSGGCM